MSDKAILDYYDRQLKEVTRTLEELWRPLESEVTDIFDVQEFTRANHRRLDLTTDSLFYHLHKDPGKGLMRYERYKHDAVIAGDSLLCSVLLAELCTYLNKSTDLDEGDATLAQGIALLHPIQLAWANHQPEKIPDLVATLSVQQRTILEQAGPLIGLTLDLWVAYSRVMSEESDLRDVEGDLQRIIAALKKWDEPDATRRLPLTALGQWYARKSLAVANRVMGYLKRLRGQMQEAVHSYRSAATLLRDVNLRVEMAITLNDMGYVLGQLGEYPDARGVIRDALSMRRRLGVWTTVGLSLNTLANIEMMEGNYSAAMKGSMRALNIFRITEYQRGRGLALLVLSESKRRQAGTDDIEGENQKWDLLKRACAHAQEAYRIFEDKESLHSAEARLEIGCAYRDQVDLWRRRPNPAEDVQWLYDESDHALRDAIRIADNSHDYVKIDALVDLAWLKYFNAQGNRQPHVEPDVQPEWDQAMAIIPQDYLFTPGHAKPAVKSEDAQIRLWPQIGKLYAMRGHSAFQRFLKAEDESDKNAALREAVEHFWLGLEYSALFGRDYFNLRREKDRIYEQLKGENEATLRQVVTQVQELERIYADTDQAQGRSSLLRELIKNRALTEIP